MRFKFYNPGELIDGELCLVLVGRHPGNPVRGYAPVYRFKMTLVGSPEEVGRIDLRVSNSHHIVMYAGHIGYRVHPKYRGNHYAARSCRLLVPLARSHGLDPLWITANPENYASRRSCELAGAKLVEIVDLPKDTDMYQMGDRQKCRYRLNL